MQTSIHGMPTVKKTLHRRDLRWNFLRHKNKFFVMNFNVEIWHQPKSDYLYVKMFL